MTNKTHHTHLNIDPLCPIGPISPILIPKSHALTHRSRPPTQCQYQPFSWHKKSNVNPPIAVITDPVGSVITIFIVTQ